MRRLVRMVFAGTLVGVSGCTCIENELKLRMQPQEQAVSAAARSDKASWREAVVRREVRKVDASGRDPFRYWTVTESILLREGPKGAPDVWHVRLATLNAQRDPTEEVRRRLDLRWVLVYAPDGHGLSVRVDRKDEAWTYVALDSGDFPLHCPHWTFGEDTDDPFGSGAAPSTRALHLDVLRGVVAKGKKHDGSVYRDEVDAAVAFTCAHRKDRELVDAVRAAVEARGKKKGPSDLRGIDASCLDEA
ncbi:MAG: hypothetical protein HYV09_10645 [Deltaproteobacteria bacterium]|nr:hypothetical protein [Deltaproteobacteria bacterium]